MRLVIYFLMMSVILFGGCSQTKQILTGGSSIAVPNEVGYYVYISGWFSLEELTAMKPPKVLDCTSYRIGANVGDNILDVTHGQLLVARKFSATDQRDQSTVNEARFCFTMNKILLDNKGEITDIELDSLSQAREDLSDEKNWKFSMFKFQIPPESPGVAYAIDLGDAGGCIYVQ